MDESMPLEQALALADHVSPMPMDAHRALCVLRERIAALESALPAPSLAEALNAIESAALAGHRMTGDDAARLRATVDRLVQQHPDEPVAMQRDAARWRALREMDGGAIYRLLGDCDGMHPEQADRAMDTYMETTDQILTATSRATP